MADGQAGSRAGAGAPVIDVPYLLALNVALLRDPDGGLHADPLWARDLLRHLAYLPRLTLLCPVEPVMAVPAGHVPVDRHRLRVVAVPAAGSAAAWLRGLPRLAAAVWREVGRARIVHTGIAGHPVPLGWLAVPMARLRRRRVVVIVESAFWRVPGGQPASPMRRLRARGWERVNRALLARVDHAFYSHEQYRASLPAPRALTSAIFQASWIDAAAVVPAAALVERWRERLAAAPTPRFLFAARMVAEKGTAVLLAAARRLAAQGADVAVDVIGTGPELAELAAEAAGDGTRLAVLAPVAYGPPLWALLARYDALLVPSLSDEQPRIVYDAYAAGVAVIASDLPGLRQCVRDGRTGRLVPAGDAAALADAIVALAGDRALARDWGLAAREFAAAHTHDRMHDDRAAVLAPFYAEPPR